MKTILKTILAITTISILTGCAGSQPFAPKIEKSENGVISIKVKTSSIETEGLSQKEKNYLEYSNDLKLSLQKAAEATLNSGNTHFIIINTNENQLQGFPINTFKDLNDYCLADYKTDKELKGKCSNFMAKAGKTSTNIKILTLKNPNYTIPAFDAKTTLQETK